MSSAPLLSPQEFAGRLRAKYPGVYDHLPDDVLTQKVLTKYPQYGGQVQIAAGPKPPENPIVKQELHNPRSPNYDAPLPGTTEGANLAEGLSNWVDQGPGNIGRGAVHAVQGKVAKGGHEILSGIGTTSLPALPLVGAAAPVATLTGLAGGTLGHAIVKPVATALGATPDQAEFAGDIGGLAGGYGGAKIPKFAGSPFGKALGGAAIEAGKAAITKIPYAGPVAEAAYKGYQASRPTPPVYPGAPLPEHPGVFPGAQYPEAPPVVVQQARALAQGGKPYVDQAAGLGRLPGKVVTPEPAPVRPIVAGPQPVAVRAPQVVAEDPAEFTRRTGLAEPAPVAVPGENKVPVAARASSQIRKAEQEGLAAKIEGRGAAKEALEKTPPVAQPTVAWDTGPRPVIQRGPIPGSRADRLETAILKDEVRSAAEGEERTINSQNKREWFARNQPGSTKGELTGSPEKPVKYSKTPGVSSPKPGTTVPAPDEDLIPILRKSLVAARRKRVSQ